MLFFFIFFIFHTQRRAFICPYSQRPSASGDGGAAPKTKLCVYGVHIVSSHLPEKLHVSLSSSSVLPISPIPTESSRQFCSTSRNLAVSLHFQLPMTRSMASVGRRCIGATLLERLLLTSAMCSCVIEVLRSGRPALKTRTLICCRSFYLLPSKLIKMRSLLGLVMHF